MASVNKVILIGNLGRDPELKYTPGGLPVCELSLATTRFWNDPDGNRKEKTEWHRVKIFGKSAERAAEVLKKGKQVYVEGRIDYREWEQDGQKRFATDIIGFRYQILGLKGAAGEAPSAGAKGVSSDVKEEDEMASEGEDLPF
jgi:single-strand DNA-binding protein